MPAFLEKPETGGPLQIYAGDPKTIIVKIQGQNRSAHTFTASLRRRRKDLVPLVDFSVTTAFDGSDTVITCYLTGDSAPGAEDGETRLVATTAYGDIQEWDEAGAALDTIAEFEVEKNEDVTR
jgi:hypothetical protein